MALSMANCSYFTLVIGVISTQSYNWIREPTLYEFWELYFDQQLSTWSRTVTDFFFGRKKIQQIEGRDSGCYVGWLTQVQFWSSSKPMMPSQGCHLKI